MALTISRNKILVVSIKVVLTVLCILFLLSSFSNAKWKSGTRAKRLISHISQTQSGRAYTYIAHDDIGPFVFIANKSLLFRAFNAVFGTSWKLKSDLIEVGKVQLWVTIGAIILVMAAPIPTFLSLSILVSFIWSHLNGYYYWELDFHWPPTIAGILAITFTVLYLQEMNSRNLQVKTIGYAIVSSLFVGYLGLLRKSSDMVVLLPTLLMLFVYFVKSIINGITSHSENKSFATKLKQNLNTNAIKLPLFFIFGLLIAFKLVLAIDIAIFEQIDDQDYPAHPQGHSVWHPLYIGLGAAPVPADNYENIFWLDGVSNSHVLQEKPDNFDIVSGREKLLKKMFMEIVLENPRIVLKSLFSKTVDIHKKRQSLLLVFAFFLIVSIVMIVRIKDDLLPLLLQLYLFGAILFTCSLPGILGHYLQGRSAYISALSMLPIIGLSNLAYYIYNFREKNKKKSDIYLFGVFLLIVCMFLQIIPIIVALSLALAVLGWWFPDRGKVAKDIRSYNMILMVFPISGVIVLVLYAVYMFGVQKSYTRNAEKLSQGEISFEEYTKGHPANLAYSFNKLSSRDRETIASRLFPETKISALFLPGNYKLIHTSLTDDHLYMLINLNRLPSHRGLSIKYFPNKKYEKHPYSKLPYTIVLPPAVSRGVYLFAARYNPDYVKAAYLVTPSGNQKITF